MKKKIRVLIVDDSSLVRETLKALLNSDPGIEVMGTAADPFFAAEKIKREVPDVITLDIEMPRMDGLTFLQKIMSQHPVPVVICSSLAEAGHEITHKALEYGAVDIIQKPQLGTKQFLEESCIRICDVVKSASQARLGKKRVPQQAIEPKLSADVILPPPSRSMNCSTERVVVVGASTGGTEALRVLLTSLPPDSPGLVIVQHMPEFFTTSFARRLDSMCQIKVKEAGNGDSVLRGQALIGPGNRHILLKRTGTKYFVEIKDGPLVCRHRPSVDVLFRTAARYAGSNAIGVIMTGMGDDGAQGMFEMKQAGAFTIAQDERTSVVFGMPQEAIKRGAVDKVLPLQGIAAAVLRRSDHAN